MQPEIEDPLFLLRGGSFIRSEITGLETAGGQVKWAHSNAARNHADQFVIATGAWLKNLAADAGTAVPLDSERGYHLVLDVQDERPLRQPIFW